MIADIKIRNILYPLSLLYEIGVEFRNKLFDWNILPAEEFSVPVISIGNLAVGGTGKTPHTEYLVRLLAKKYKISVLSRGYRRKTKGFVLAGENVSAQSLGDEPFQIYRKFPEIIVAVDGNRRRGIQNLLKLPENKRPEIILLDDAFQHRYVTPSLSILLTESNCLFYDDKLLPVGRLREPAKNSSRADIVICTKCPESFKPIDYRIILKNMDLDPHQQLYFTSYLYKSLLSVFPENTFVKKESIERLKKESYSFLLIAGISRPQELIKQLGNYTSDLQTLIYPDHYNFKAKDIAEIAEIFTGIKNNNKMIITSEKDAVRLMSNAFVPEEIKAFIYCLPIEVAFREEQESLFIQKIENHVSNFKRNRILA
ncbi:MAG: tetraacyldisaccharide 4'-kinase [Dysgonamonadaceae bacterium]|jgi:tetraacyldisaccharide 4'-kinase|nr:tetraacyldisaccharide 4'-kinase [Dysgonamonadaceae bacterium]